MLSDNNLIHSDDSSEAGISINAESGEILLLSQEPEPGDLTEKDIAVQEPASFSEPEDKSDAAPEEDPEDTEADLSQAEPEDETEAEPEVNPEEVPEDTAEEQPEDTSETVLMTEEDASDKKPKKKTAGLKLKLFLVLLVAIAVCALLFVLTHAILGDIFGKHDIFSYRTTEINLSGSDYGNYSQLSKVKSLEVIDLTHSSFDSLSDLYGCTNLKKVILKDKELSAEECAEVFSRVPDAVLVCRISINGQVLDSEVTRLKVDKADQKTQKLFAVLKKLESLDLKSCDVSDDTFAYLAEALPQCNIVIRTTICGNEYTTDAATVSLDGKLTEQDVKRVGYFRNLTVLDLRKCENPEALDSFLSSHKDVRLNTPIDLLGVTVGSEDELADLRGNKYTLEQVKSALDEALPKMKSLKKIDMCGCGLTNSEMEELCNEYPDIQFVWIVRFRRWAVRTDAVVFSTLNGNGMEFFDQKDYAPVFKYCTDLVAIDLGHSLIYDTSPMASLTKLRAVILTDNKIHNISSFANMKDLEFIEMNVNRVESAEPLKNLTKLKYINFWSSKGLTDLSPLYNHDELRIAILHRTISEYERNKFRRSNPKCEVFFKVDYKLSTNAAWRKNPYRKKLKAAFKDWKYVVGFDEKTGKYIFDYNTDQYSIM